MLDPEHLVPAAGAVQAELRPVGAGREGVLHLVAVAEDLLRRHDRLDRRVGDPGDPPERVLDPRRLGLDLRLVGEVLEAAAAAGGEVLAERLDPRRPALDELDRLRLGVAALHLRHAGANRVAGKPAPDEDDEAAEPGDPVPAVGERVDLELDLVSSMHRRGH